MNCIYHTYSHIGTRHNNQDSYTVCSGRNGFAAAVADGLGGYKGGEIASKLFIEEFESAFESEGFDLEQTYAEANEMILDAQEEYNNSMKTTAAAVWIDKTRTIIANVGDSRVYAFKGGAIVFQSIDHSVAQMCVDSGEITPDMIRTHEDRCILTRSLGGRSEVPVDISRLDNTDYDSLLLCSDGFWEHVYEQEMCETLKQSQTPQQWLEKMVTCRRSNVTSDNDNNTAVVIMTGEG